MASDLENDSVLRTKRARRCLGQNGTCRACPLTEGIVEALDMVGQAGVFADRLMLLVGEDVSVGPPEVGIDDALPVAVGNGPPQLLRGRFTPTANHTSDDLPGGSTQCQPNPTSVAFMTHE